MRLLALKGDWGGSAAFGVIASEIRTPDIKYLRKKHKTFAYIGKKHIYDRFESLVGAFMAKDMNFSRKSAENLRICRKKCNFAKLFIIMGAV